MSFIRPMKTNLILEWFHFICRECSSSKMKISRLLTRLMSRKNSLSKSLQKSKRNLKLKKRNLMSLQLRFGSSGSSYKKSEKFNASDPQLLIWRSIKLSLKNQMVTCSLELTILSLLKSTLQTSVKTKAPLISVRIREDTASETWRCMPN